uniref:Pheromone B alpha 1 receptor n=1 Tax=Mycena chlorophos TaxID=658473 RepID=A0ABQ0LJP2_MYCCL|nr:pheromone B alpha 1 receptor [Mycena chlorophos]
MSYYYTGPPHWLFSTLAFLGFVLSFIPLPWHLRGTAPADHLPVSAKSLADLPCSLEHRNMRVHNTLDSAPVWCDLSTYFLAALNLAVPATSLCINRRLYYIVYMKAPRQPTPAQRRRAMAMDLFLSFGSIPLLQLPLCKLFLSVGIKFSCTKAQADYIVQGRRYMIVEDVGCTIEVDFTPVAITVTSLPPILIGVVSMAYCIPSIWKFLHLSRDAMEIFGSTSSVDADSLTPSRYLRLACLATCDVVFTIPLSAWVLATNIREAGVQPWISWADTHSDFNVIPQLPSSVWRMQPAFPPAVQFARWATVGCAFLFFGFFGFAGEARVWYAAMGRRIAAALGVKAEEKPNISVLRFQAGSSDAQVRFSPVLGPFWPNREPRVRFKIRNFRTSNPRFGSVRSGPAGSCLIWLVQAEVRPGLEA